MPTRVRPLSKRRAKRQACLIAAGLIESYFDVGQPDSDCCDGGVRGWIPEDVAVLTNALEELVTELLRRAGPEAER